MYTLTMKPNYRKISGLLYGACIEDVNHELYGGIWSQMIFGESFAEPAKEVGGCSGMWELTIKGTARGNVPVATEDCYIGSQSQRIEFLSGIGSVGINNMGLNRSGMYFASNKEYQGYIYARADQPIQVYAMLENEDGSQCYGEASFVVNGDWQKYSFCLLTDGEDYKGRFTLEIREQGRLEVGYVYLEPGEWGRYKGLPVRRDVGEMLEKQGIGVLRMGGCMTNAPEYRWKKMIGLREERGGYKGWWYPYASYGFGIVEFLNLCEALGVEAVPDFLCDESAQDMEDFAHFAYGTDSADPWVRMRQEMGHREPYDLKYIQIGNENKINREFGAHFNEIANRIWAVNPKVTLIVGDFIYNEVIEDPWNFGGSEAKITSLEGHKMILDNAEAQGRTVWFDIHFWSETGRHPYDSFEPALSFAEEADFPDFSGIGP